jgi:mannonate dehydratase
MKEDRRDFIKKGSALAALSVIGMSPGNAGLINQNAENKIIGSKEPAQGKKVKKVQWPILEGPDTPKLMINMPAVAKPWTPERIKMIKQAGSDYTLMSGPKIPWTVDILEGFVAPFKAEKVIVYNLMIEGFPNVMKGTPGRDKEIEDVKASLIAAGKVGIPVVEYNWYPSGRLGVGYNLNDPAPERGDAGYASFDAKQMRNGIPANNQPPTERSGVPISKEQSWANLTYFLKEIIPVAEKAGVRMALHPNDPPVSKSYGTEQIMITFNDWKRLVNIVDSPSNGITYDCGVSAEIGEDPIEVLRYMAVRDRINHVHYRNCIVEIPSEKYIETFPDNGKTDMLSVMQELIRHKYTRGIFPEHPRVLLYDKDRPGELSGYMYNLAYARAMFQAAWAIEMK